MSGTYPAAVAHSGAVARLLASQRRRLRRRRPMRDLTVTVPGAEAPYLAHAPTDPDQVLDEVASRARDGDEGEPHMPYWATPWASGLGLAEVVLRRRDLLRGRRVLELGCGLGITGIAAMQAGARLTLADCFPEALLYSALNVLRNTGRRPRTMLADWRQETDRRRLLELGRFDLLLAADVLYEPDDIAPLLDLAPRLLHAPGAFWLAEPGRATSERFVAAAAERRWQDEVVEMERDWPGEAGHARVRVHLYRAVGSRQ